MTVSTEALPPALVEQQAEAAARLIPPLWPLDASVAVNPYLGHANDTLAEAGARLARAGGMRVTMPRAWYRTRLEDGTITDGDLAAALAADPHEGRPADAVALRRAAGAECSVPRAVPTVAELAAAASGTDWPALVADRFAAWAAGWFDAGQALWSAPRDAGAWPAWRGFATRDLSPEIHGLSGFAAFVAAAPADPIDALVDAVRRLGLSEAALGSAFHRTLVSLGGWAQLARYRLWQAELAGGTDRTLIELLAIGLRWEAALLARHSPRIADSWQAARTAYAARLVPDQDQIIDAILQDAADRAAQRVLAETLAAPASLAAPERPAVQAAFCIDVRSEVFRRALEAVDPSIRTLGFAGFFGIFAQHRRFASDVAEKRLPVLLNPTQFSCSGGPATADADRAARLAARARRAWRRFRQAAVSSFAFVEATGPVYAGKLLRDALGQAGTPAPAEPAPRLDPALAPEARIAAAETVLRAMSLTGGFAPLVLLAGHGASAANNPHLSALHCGACGGFPGDVNARLLAALLNDFPVREGLAERGIAIPADTLFVAGLHDTTTDEVALFDQDSASPAHAAALDRLRRWLADAGRLSRAERVLRLPRTFGGADVVARSRDWAEVRPEWGLAGCRAFIAAPRARTQGRDLGGKAFLHDYDWRADAVNGFPVLELIMTAPVVVASWISLQYYASVVAPDQFGAGNKLLHNVVGGIGVLEGNGGTLRAGLPWQSVHDGTQWAHDPLRLSVCIAAPVGAMGDILARHPGVRTLFDRRWLHLFALAEDGRMTQRYAGDLRWEAVVGPGAAELRVAA